MKKWFPLLIIIVATAVFFFMGFIRNSSNLQDGKDNSDIDTNISNISNTPELKGSPKIINWQVQGAAISGGYGDAEIVNFGDKYRLYYSEEPETSGFSGKVYSAVSNDGKLWAQESGIRKEWATFASIIKLSDGKYRMYFQNAGVIKSALSSDGLSWQDESDTRIDESNSFGLNLENVAAPTIMKVGNEYIMVYRADISGKYSSEVPNSNTQILLWASSDDGLVFEKKGIALDSRNEELQGLADGPEFIDFNGEIRLYFWGYSGVYHLIFKDNKFSSPEFDFSVNINPNVKFSPDPPCDPTIIKISNEWVMYYGQHTKGIYYATLKE